MTVTSLGQFKRDLPTSEAPVLVVDDWSDNSWLMIDMARLGYIYGDVLDPTYGKNGTWWKHWAPEGLVATDLKPTGDLVADFTRLPFADGSFDCVTFDPPYVATGGRNTSTVPEFNERYGIGGESPATPAMLQDLINEGMTECARVLRYKQRKTKLRPGHRGGLLLVKCTNYVSSGKLWPGTFLTYNYATETLGLRLKDMFIHQGEPGMQPERERADGMPVVQQHGRANSSTLLVFEKGWPMKEAA